MSLLSPPLLFALNTSKAIGVAVAAQLGLPLAAHEERDFEDGEHKARPLVGVQGADAVLVQSLHGEPGVLAQSANDKLVRLLFFAACLRDQGARRITALLPYLAYARKDRRSKPQDPVSSRYVAQLIEAAGIDAVVALEVHNVAAFENAFRIPVLHVPAAPLFIAPARRWAGDGPIAVVSPDPGGVKRAQLCREMLESALRVPVGTGYLEKRRSDDVVSGSLLAGDVRDATVLLVDDLISSGGTMLRAAQSCLAAGARRVVALAAHGLFSAGADALMTDPALTSIVVSNSVPVLRLPAAGRARIEVVDCAPLLAGSIRTLHPGCFAAADQPASSSQAAPAARR